MRDGPGVLTRNHSRKKEKRIFKDKREALDDDETLTAIEPAPVNIAELRPRSLLELVTLRVAVRPDYHPRYTRYAPHRTPHGNSPVHIYTFVHLPKVYIYTFVHLYICTFIHLYIYTHHYLEICITLYAIRHAPCTTHLHTNTGGDRGESCHVSSRHFTGAATRGEEATYCISIRQERQRYAIYIPLLLNIVRC